MVVNENGTHKPVVPLQNALPVSGLGPRQRFCLLVRRRRACQVHAAVARARDQVTALAVLDAVLQSGALERVVVIVPAARGRLEGGRVQVVVELRAGDLRVESVEAGAADVVRIDVQYAVCLVECCADGCDENTEEEESQRIGAPGSHRSAQAHLGGKPDLEDARRAEGLIQKLAR